jgi:hypothetical protein
MSAALLRGRAESMKLGIKQGVVSAGVFAALMFVLASVDERVQERFSELLNGNSSMSSIGHRASELTGALVLAVKYQSIDNAPMMLFAVVGAVLFLFMVRT